MYLWNKKRLFCSFCFCGEFGNNRITIGAYCFICSKCLLRFNIIMGLKKIEKKKIYKRKIRLPNPRKIKEYLDSYIIGQEHAKKTVSVAIYNHYKRINILLENKDLDIKKSNILLIGETGTGKTLLAKSVSKLLRVPFTIIDVTTLTQAGFVGEDIEGILKNLLGIVNNNVKKAEQGIVYLDEIDKISKRATNQTRNREMTGQGVQQCLLKLLEGTDIRILPRNLRKDVKEKEVTINTENILFICGGTFVGLKEIINNRNGINQIGFELNTSRDKVTSPLKNLKISDLMVYGLIPEFIGRLPIVTTLKDINEEDLLVILKCPKNSLIKQYRKLFMVEGVNLIFENIALYYIAKKSISKNGGARGLRIVMEGIVLELMYDIIFLANIYSCMIDKRSLLNKSKPILKFIRILF